MGHLLALVVVVSFSSFGAWQLRRHEQRAVRNAVAEARMAAAPVDLETALSAAAARGGVDARGVDALAFRRVALTGVFDPASEVLRRPVARDGTPGFNVITPLVLDGGSAVLVERGWVPRALDAVPVVEAPPPAGEVTIHGWTFPTERPPTGALAALAPRDPAEGPLRTVAYVDESRLAAQMPYPLEPAVVLLDAPPRAPGDRTLPLPPPPPSVDAGPHLGYALQWFSFVVIVLVGYAALVRRVALEGPAPGPERRANDPG